MRANISTQAKTWLRIEMSARVEPVAILRGSSSAPREAGALRAAPGLRALTARSGPGVGGARGLASGLVLAPPRPLPSRRGGPIPR